MGAAALELASRLRLWVGALVGHEEEDVCVEEVGERGREEHTTPFEASARHAPRSTREQSLHLLAPSPRRLAGGSSGSGSTPAESELSPNSTL